MSRYIDADALKSQKEYCEERHEYIVPVAKIDWMPTAYVAPLVLGWWERVDSSYYRWTPSGGTLVDCATYRCSRCGRGTAVKSNYCPNCGAKMDGEEDSNNQKGAQE